MPALSVQVDVRSAAVGGQRGDPRRQGARSGAGALRNLWQNMWRNNGEGEAAAEGTPGFQVSFNTVPVVCPLQHVQIGIAMLLPDSALLLFETANMLQLDLSTSAQRLSPTSSAKRSNLPTLARQTEVTYSAR